MIRNSTALWFLAVLSLAAALLLPDLATPEFRTWDEGLYGRFARAALHNGSYLVAVDEDGAYFERFSKPPLTIWATALSLHVLGPSVEALRVPFVLGMLGLIATTFGWGRRIGGLPMAVAWAGTMTLTAATLRWGRHACMEPMFLAGLVGGLWAYHESLVREGRGATRWAVIAGLFLAFAFMAKQLAFGLAVVPIVMLEVLRRDRASLRRLAFALGIPTAIGATWFALAIQATDGAVLHVLVRRGLVNRMSGFSSGQNARTLNELIHVVGDASEPLWWPLGATGLVVLAMHCHNRDAPRRPTPAMLLPLSMLTVVLIFENLSRSMLPWYALHLVVPLMGGAAWCIAGLFDKRETHDDKPTPIARARAVLGWLAVGTIAVLGAEPIGSTLNVAAVAALWGFLMFATKRLPTWLPVALAGVIALFGRAHDAELHSPEPPFSPLMAALSEHEAVAVHRNTAMAMLAHRTLFGHRSETVRRAPWPTSEFTAYVTAQVIPAEFSPPQGVSVIRTAGATAFVGDLDQPVWSDASLAKLLDAGPITFEAEWLGATHWWTTFEDPSASGGRLRRYERFRTEKSRRVPLSVGPKVRLPPGTYALEVWLDWSCPAREAQQSAVSISLKASGEKLVDERLSCEDTSGELAPHSYEFVLESRATIALRVGHLLGSVSHDKTVLRRVD